MKTQHPSAAIVLGLALTLSGQAWAQTGHHDHEGHAAPLTLNHGQKWPTDETLRNGMETLRAAFSERLQAIHDGSLPAAGYKELGEKAEKIAATIVAECKLDPQADAMLHPLIAEMVAGADIMQGAGKEKPVAGAHRVAAALNKYGRYFDHPRWQGLQGVK